MFKLVVAGTIAVLATAQNHPVNEDIIQEIKEKTSRWEPIQADSNPLANKSMDEIMGLLGTHIQGPVGLPGPMANGVAPKTFDSETLSDRFCIASGKKVNVVLSP
jgi:hypothetical protein